MFVQGEPGYETNQPHTQDTSSLPRGLGTRLETNAPSTYTPGNDSSALFPAVLISWVASLHNCRSIKAQKNGL